MSKCLLHTESGLKYLDSLYDTVTCSAGGLIFEDWLHYLVLNIPLPAGLDILSLDKVFKGYCRGKDYLIILKR